EQRAKLLHEKLLGIRKARGLPNFAMNIVCGRNSDNRNYCNVHYLEETIHREMVQYEKDVVAKIEKEKELEKIQNSNVTQGKGNLPVFFASAAAGALGFFVAALLPRK